MTRPHLLFVLDLFLSSIVELNAVSASLIGQCLCNPMKLFRVDHESDTDVSVLLLP